MAIEIGSFANMQSMEVGVDGPQGANRLFIYTGTALFDFKGVSGDWRRDTVQFHVGRSFGPGEVIKAIGTGSLASICNEHHAVDAGWAIDDTDADWDDEDGRIQVRASVAVRDSDGHVLRMSYIVHVLAKLPVKQSTIAPITGVTAAVSRKVD
ncbi:MAG: hypothetical protein NTW07_03770 [candidate division Zixibacteria bacterium]|nr:hypothetical protein [candidate division Zixibacteria bacterium]